MAKLLQILIGMGLPVFLAECDQVRAGQPQPKLAALIEKLKDQDRLVRRETLAALGRAGKDAKAAIPVITILLKDTDPIVRIYAATALRAIDPETKIALPVLLDALRVKDQTVRCYAVSAFKEFGTNAVPPLIEVFREKDRSAHMWASGAIAHIGKDAVPYLLKARDDLDPLVRSNVEETLEFIKTFGMFVD